MRTRHSRASRTPQVNLVPMMDVLMTVLIFFVIISMGLTGVQINGVTLPRSVSGADEKVSEKDSDAAPLVIGLDQQGELILDGEVTTVGNLAPTIQAYFQETPDGSIMLKADRGLPYDEIADLLAELRQIGGRRVSLAVE